MTFSRSRRAYTLLEVLVVLGIMALLAAILLPVFARVRENGRKTVCLSNMRQIMLAVSLYTQDSAGQFPPAIREGDALAFGLGCCGVSWTNPLSTYLSTPQLLHCPSDELWTQREKPSLVVGWQPIPSSYIANERCLTQKFATYPYLAPPNAGPMVPFTYSAFERDIVRPSTTVWMCDGVQNAWQKAPYTQDYQGNLSSSQAAMADVLEDPIGAPAMNYDNTCCDCVYAPTDRHLGRANVAFADGHVKAMNNADWYFPNTPWLDPKRGG